MKHLISREDYINEYLHISKDIKNENELYEGLLSTVFGGLKMLFKKDWANIKCKNPTVLTYLKEIDKSLSGYTMTKMQFSAECNNIRQNIADYFNDILDYKLLQIEKEENAEKYLENEDKEIEENTENKGVAKYLNIKDKTLLDSLKKYKENISTSCKKSSKLKEYADQMLNSVVVFVNDIVIKELEKKGVDKSKLDEKKKKLEEEEKKLKETRDKMDELARKADKDILKKLSDERDKALKDIEIKPIGAMSGDKSVEMIVKQFSDMMKEFNGGSSKNFSDILENILDSDTYIGIKNTIHNLNLDLSNIDIEDEFLIKLILYKINTVFKDILKDKNMFKGVPSASVQAMMVSLSNVIIYGYMGEDKFKIDDIRISLLTKCAIDSDATIGFNLPLIDPAKPDSGNLFIEKMNQFKNDDISSKEVENVLGILGKKDLKQIAKKYKANSKDISDISKKLSPTIMKKYRQNITELFDLIRTKANELKDEAEKEREKDASKGE